VVHLIVTRAVDAHIIDLHPVLYVFQPSFANTPYGALLVFTNATDLPGLALGYQPAAIHFVINDHEVSTHLTSGRISPETRPTL
jgi:hypothetical protein